MTVGPVAPAQLSDLALHTPLPVADQPHRLSVADRLDVIELDARCNLAIDTRNDDELLDVVTDDAVFSWQFGYREGAVAAVELIRQIEPGEKMVRHQNTDHVIRGNADGSATMTSYLMAVRVDGAEGGDTVPFIVAHGSMTHRLRKVDGDWRIAALVLDQTSTSRALLTDADRWSHDAATADVRAQLDGGRPVGGGTAALTGA